MLSDKRYNYVVLSQNSYCSTVNKPAFIQMFHSTGIPTFVNETLHLVINVQLVKCLILLNEQLIQHYLSQEFTMYFVTKAMPIDNIDGVYHIKKLRSSRTFLTSYSSFISLT